MVTEVEVIVGTILRLETLRGGANPRMTTTAIERSSAGSNLQGADTTLHWIATSTIRSKILNLSEGG